MYLDQELKELQRQLANVDLLSKQRRQTNSKFLGFLVIDLKYIKIKMYQEQNHRTPHVHIDYGREHHVASYRIEDGQRLAGSLDEKYEQEIVAWIEKFRDKLLSVWEITQKGQDPKEIVAEIQGSITKS